jgi:hypothetical protein
MRLSEFRAKAPFKDAVAPKVVAVIEQALVALGADVDPVCWVAWGDDPRIRYLVFAPTPAGLGQVNVRVAVPGEGPRASGKLIRWNRVQLGEMGVEIQGGHRLVTFQVETQVLNGADASADAIAAFAQILLAAVDGRPIATPAKSIRTSATKPSTGGPSAARTKPPAKAMPRLAPRKGSPS